MTDRIRLDDLTDDQLDALYTRLDLMSRALDRAEALADQWAADMTQISRSEAADLFATVLELHGWEQEDPQPAPALRLITKETPA